MLDRPDVEKAALAGLPAVTQVTDAHGSVELTTSDPQMTLAGLLDLASGHGLQLTELAVVRPSLEDVFLDLTGRELRE